MLYRISQCHAELGLSRTQFYEGVAAGTVPRPVKLGLRAAALPDHEVKAVAQARVAGLTTDEIKRLVDRLHAQRAALAAELRAEVA